MTPSGGSPPSSLVAHEFSCASFSEAGSIGGSTANTAGRTVTSASTVAAKIVVLMASLCQRQEFIRILEEDVNTVQSILAKVRNKKERGNIALRLWTGCICAAKECRRTSVTEHNPDGTTKRETIYTPERRNKSFKKIMITSSEDPIYEAGVETAPVWELILNARNNKKMYLDGIPNLNSSPVTRYLKDRNKTIISVEDIEVNN
jgi:hypothetical protein